MKAIWNGKVLAESDDTIIVEGNHYFPPNSIRNEFFNDSNTSTHCGWKGICSYFTVSVDGQENPDSAWYYESPREVAKEIQGYIAFWRGVEVIK